MIRFLQGTVYDQQDRSLVLLIQGVGYHILVPSRLQFEKGTQQELHIHTHVREDALALFGFIQREELEFFELLITVNGIGPKMAMEILNEPVSNIKNAIFSGNIAGLTKISGVGKKLAERLVLELKGKVEPEAGSSLKSTVLGRSKVDEDASAALETLGYKRNHIERVLSEVPEEITSSEAIIRYFLQRV